MKCNMRRVFILVLVLTSVMGPVRLLRAQSQNAVGGGANGASSQINATILGVPTNVSMPSAAPVTLPPNGGSFSNQVNSSNAEIPGVLPGSSTGTVIDTTSGSVTQSSAHAESRSEVNNVNMLGGLITASKVVSQSASDGNGSTATSSAAGSYIEGLKIGNNVSDQREFPPNTSIPFTGTVASIVGGLPVNVPVNGTVILNEQTSGGNGTTTSSLAVSYMHVTVSGSVPGSISFSEDHVIASASSSVIFTASAANNPPALSLPGPQSVQAGSTLNFAVSASDPDAGDNVTLTASGLPPNGSFTPNPAMGNPAQGQFSFTPTSAQAGQTYTINFNARDSRGATTSGSVVVSVTSPPPPGDNPPVLTIPGPQTAQVGTTLTFGVSASDPDSGDTVTLTASGIPPNATVTPNPATGNPASAQFSFTPSQAQVGQTFVVVFNAADSHGASTADSVSVRVIAAPPTGDNPPTLILPGPQTAEVGKTLVFGVSASDPDAGDIVTLTASGVPFNANVNPNPASGNPATAQFSFTPTPAQVGQIFLIVFNATDSHGASTSGSVQVTVKSAQNHPPMISVPGPQLIGVGQTLTFAVIGSDPDGDAVTLSGSSVPANASFNPSTGGFTFTPANNQLGQVYVVTFTATDSKGSSTSATVPITVISSSTPGPPIISVPPSPIVVSVGNTVDFIVGAVSSIPNCAVHVSTSELPAHAAFDEAANHFLFTPTLDQADKTFLEYFTAIDCNGQTATAAVTIIVVRLEAVGTPGRICVPITKLFFDPTTTGGCCGVVTFTLTNMGSGLLTIRSVSFIDGTNYRLDGLSGLPLVLQGGGTISVKIAFEPKQSGTLLDTLTISTSDPDQPTITIDLKGKGLKQ